MLAIHRSARGVKCQRPKGGIWWQGLEVSGDGFSGQGFLFRNCEEGVKVGGGLRWLNRREGGKVGKE